jgi:hypothetical protein
VIAKKIERRNKYTEERRIWKPLSFKTFHKSLKKNFHFSQTLYKQFSNMTASNLLVTLYPQNNKFNSCKNFCVEICSAIVQQKHKKQSKLARKNSAKIYVH